MTIETVTTPIDPPRRTRRTNPHPELSSQFDVKVGDTNGLHFLLGFLMVLDGQYVPGIWLPYAMVLVIIFVFVATWKAPVRRLAQWQWTAWVFVLLMIYVSVVSIVADSDSAAFAFSEVGGFDWARRALRISIVIVFAFFVGTERLEHSAVLRGLGVGLVFNAACHYLYISPHTYGIYLTGWLTDKNRAGLYYAVGGVLAQAYIRRPFPRILVGALTVAATWATGSRTSMIAYAMGMVWVWIISRQIGPLRWLSAGVMMWFIQFWEENYSRIGEFADRAGSDWFRARIDAASQLKLEGTPFQGLGLGQAYVTLDGDRWLFHNAYWTLLVEGGWIYCIGMVGLLVIVGLRPFSSGTRVYAEQVAQGATVALLIFTWILGEVFLTLPWALVFGLSLNLLLPKPKPDAEDSALQRMIDESAWRLHARDRGSGRRG